MAKSWVYRFFYPPDSARHGWSADYAGMDRFMNQYRGYFFCCLLWSTLVLLISPLERLAFGWFWGFWAALAIGESFPYQSWLRWHRRVILVISWPLSVLILAVLLWDELGYFDRFTHGLRCLAGYALQLHRLVGMEHLHDATCILIAGGLGLWGFVSETRQLIFGPEKSRRPERY